jgi:hypothetical protein
LTQKAIEHIPAHSPELCLGSRLSRGAMSVRSRPHPLACAQALDTWAAGRERAIEKLVREAEALEEHDPVEEAACTLHAVLRLRESARRERAEADALRATWSRCGKEGRELESA